MHIRDIKFFSVIASDKTALCITAGLIAVVGVFDILIPLGFRIVLDDLLPAGDAGQLMAFGLGIAMLIAAQFVMVNLQDICMFIFKTSVIAKLIKVVFYRLLDNGKSILYGLERGDTTNRITTTIERVGDLVAPFLYFCFYGIFIASINIVLIFSTNLIIGSIMVATIVLHTLYNLHVYKKFEAVVRPVREATGSLVEELNTYYDGRNTILVSRKLAFFFERISNKIFLNYHKNWRYAAESINIGLTLDTITNIGKIVVVVVSILLTVRGEMSFGSMVMIYLLFYSVFEPIYQFSGFIQAKAECDIIFDRLNEVLPKQKVEAIQSKQAAQELACVQFKDAALQYDDGKQLFEDFNYRFHIGKAYLVLGPSGAGKSSLLSLINGSTQLTAGTLAFCSRNGIDENPWSKVSWCFNTGPVFSGDPKEVVTDFSLKADNAGLERAINLSQSAHLFKPRGSVNKNRHFAKDPVKYSQGEQQRLNVCRTMYQHQAGRVLLFDEPSSFLDPATEYKLMQGIVSYKTDSIVIVVSHNSGLAPLFDDVLEFRNGKICAAEVLA